MSALHLEVLVEDYSTEAALRVLLPRILGSISFEVYPHSCKQDLMDRLPERLRGYRRWLPEDYFIVILVDRDNDDCHELKAAIERIAQESGFATRSRPRAGRFQIVTRLAVEELEAWFFGDWAAVQAAYPGVPATIPLQARYRHPDAIPGGTWEALERILQRAGYHMGGLRKIEAARTIADRMSLTANSSKSFAVFHRAVAQLAEV